MRISLSRQDSLPPADDDEGFLARPQKFKKKKGKIKCPLKQESYCKHCTIQHLKSGRRSTGSSYAAVHGSGTQLKARTRLNSLEEGVPFNEETGGEIFLLHDVLASDQEYPGTKATRKRDWKSMMKALTPRDQAVINCIVEGRSLRHVAKLFRVSNSTMQGTRRKLGMNIQDYMGYKILIDVQLQPKWRNDLPASKEKLACKHGRSSH